MRLTAYGQNPTQLMEKMKMESVKLVYFSPTGTTKAVVQSIAHGIGPGTVELIDITGFPFIWGGCRHY